MTQGRRSDDGHNQISEAHASQEPYMSEFIVRVTCFELNYRGQVAGQIAEAFVPVEAKDEDEACQRAVLWHGDNGVAVEDDDLQWQCIDLPRALVFKATKCLEVTASELEVFLSLTQGLSGAKVIGRSTSQTMGSEQV
ncbi:TPA: hypothetical protein L6A07_24790 [Pseudomonas aeruginosa]|nr:hypothetical protein [Pseudomonas aeruginosa]